MILPHCWQANQPVLFPSLLNLAGLKGGIPPPFPNTHAALEGRRGGASSPRAGRPRRGRQLQHRKKGPAGRAISFKICRPSCSSTCRGVGWSCRAATKRVFRGRFLLLYREHQGGPDPGPARGRPGPGAGAEKGSERSAQFIQGRRKLKVKLGMEPPNWPWSARSLRHSPSFDCLAGFCVAAGAPITELAARSIRTGKETA